MTVAAESAHTPPLSQVLAASNIKAVRPLDNCRARPSVHFLPGMHLRSHLPGCENLRFHQWRPEM